MQPLGVATIVEGLEPNIDHGTALRALRTALEFDPTAVVVGFRCVPYQDSTNDFIFADLDLSPGVNCATRKVSHNMVACFLPHIAFHIALGTCTRTMGASQRAIQFDNATIRGAFLVLERESLRVSPPPEEKRKGKKHQRHHYNRGSRGFQGCPKWQQQVSVTKK